MSSLPTFLSPLPERAGTLTGILAEKMLGPHDWDRGGHPSQMWDDKSTPPMLCFARFDLIDSSFVTALMAETTPAWREGYVVNGANVRRFLRVLFNSGGSMMVK